MQISVGDWVKYRINKKVVVGTVQKVDAKRYPPCFLVDEYWFNLHEILEVRHKEEP